MIEKRPWQDQDLANAFVEKGKMHDVQISPETAMQLATEVRSKVKQGDVLEIESVIKDVVKNLFPSDADMELAASVNDIFGVALSRYKKFKDKLAAIVLAQSGPISPEEESELRGELLKDVIIPFQEGIDAKVADATRQYLREMYPISQEKKELETALDANDADLERLEAEVKANPNDRGKKKLLAQKNRERDEKMRKALALGHKLDVLQSKIILLDTAMGYVKRTLSVVDQYRGMDGMSRYFERAFVPAGEKIKEAVGQARQNIVLPEVSAKSRHNREWILRHHLTKTYQEATIGPSHDAVTLDDLKKSPVYAELVKQGMSEQAMSAAIDNLNKLPMTWRKGHAIYMLLDPPAEKTVHHDIPTLMEDSPVGAEGWGAQIVTNQPFNIEKGKFDEQKSKMETGTKPQAASKDRKLSEAANEKAHWTVLMNLSRNQRVDKTGKTRAEKYLESVPEEMRTNPEVEAKAEEMDDEDSLHDEDIIYAALNNPATPDWVLMKAAIVGYATKIRRIAKAILQRRRGWQPKLDANGNLIKDQTTNDFVWERIPGFSAIAALVAKAQTKDQYNMARQGYQDQINRVDEQMKTLTAQMEQLRVQKTTLEKQRDSVKAPPTQTATTPAPAQGTPPPVPTGTPPPAPAMAVSQRSVIRLGQELGLDTELEMQEDQPEEGDFVYDDASSGLSVYGEKYIGKFTDWDTVVEVINEYAHKHKFYPNVWQVSDHGNWHQVKDFKYTEAPAENLHAIEKPFYQRMRDRMK